MARKSYCIDPSRAGQARTKAGLTQQQVADQLGCSRITINKIENGRANVSLSLVEGMANLYAVTREWLLGELDPAAAHHKKIVTALGKLEEGLGDIVDIVEELNAEAAAAAAAHRAKPKTPKAPVAA